MSRRTLISLSLLATLTSCAEFPVGRSFLAEMERDDSPFFSPREDFPVVAGDTGDEWINDKQRRSRTPASEEMVLQERQNSYLRAELRSLEKSQPDDALNFYETYKSRLPTVSERIYFLKLPHYERKDYLMSRGIIPEPKKVYFTEAEKDMAVKNSDIMMGMKKQDVLTALGKPARVEVAGNPRNENERWLYQVHGASKYIYFESGEVQGWE